MAEIIIAPDGGDTLDVGLMIDEHEQRFVVLTFKRPDDDPVLVTFSPSMFAQYAAYLGRAADFARDESNWQAAS